MTTTTPQKLIWENPSTLFNVTVPINITWSLSTFNAINLGNFELNMWLLRHDNAGVTVLKSYPPILLAGQHKAQETGILFTPSTDDLDIGIVQEGNHQLTWEFYNNNTALNPAAIKGKGFSKGFQFRANAVSSSSSSSSSTTQSSTTSAISSSQTSQTSQTSIETTTSSSSSIATTSGTAGGATTTTTPNANSATTAPTAASTAGSTTINPSTNTNQGVIIGLSVGFGILLGAAIIGLLFWFLHRRSKTKAEELANMRKDSEGSSLQDLAPKNGNVGWDGGGGGGNYTNGGGGVVGERGGGINGGERGFGYPSGKKYHRYEPVEYVEAGSGKREGPVEAGSGRRSLGPVELA